MITLVMSGKKRYDAVIVLGYKQKNNWDLPLHLKKRLKKVALLYKEGLTGKIIVCGKWSLVFEEGGAKPEVTESEIMKKFLLNEGIPDRDIIKEEKSKDTIGNAYFVKRGIIVPNSYKRILIACADFHLDRVKFIFNKVFGKGYDLEFLSTETIEGRDRDLLKRQNDIFESQKKFLWEMDDGDINFLRNRLYRDPFFHGSN